MSKHRSPHYQQPFLESFSRPANYIHPVVHGPNGEKYGYRAVDYAPSSQPLRQSPQVITRATIEALMKEFPGVQGAANIARYLVNFPDARHVKRVEKLMSK